MIRPALAADAPGLLELMRSLARFEGYDQQFAVTIDALLKRGLQPDRPPEFFAWVAELDDDLVGYALVYVIPFTFDLRPTVVLKELFIDEMARDRTLGRELMGAVIDHAASLDARLIRWQVLPNNEPAKRFYQKLGGAMDMDWESWFIDLDRR